MVCNLMTDKSQWTETVRILKEGGVPSFSLPGEAARAMTALARYSAIRSRDIGQPDTFEDVDKTRAQGIIDKASAAGHNFLPAADVYQILEAYKIPTAGWRMAASAEEAAAAAEEIGFPVVVKADAAAIVHKSDMGGVAVNLADSACRTGGCQGNAGTVRCAGPDILCAEICCRRHGGHPGCQGRTRTGPFDHVRHGRHLCGGAKGCGLQPDAGHPLSKPKRCSTASGSPPS